MRTLLTFIISLFFIGAFAQQGDDYFSLEQSKAMKKPSFVKDTLTRPVSYSMQMGTSFSNFAGTGNMFSNYVSPMVNYDVSSRFRARIGGLFVNTNFYGKNNFGSEQSTSSNVSVNRIFLFVQGQYLLSKNMTISGTIFKEVTPTPKMNDRAFDMSSETYSVGMEYRLGNNSTIGVEMNFYKNISPYNYHHRSSFSPFFASPYGW